MDRQGIVHLYSKMKPSWIYSCLNVPRTCCEHHGDFGVLPPVVLRLVFRIRMLSSNSTIPRRLHVSCPSSSRAARIPVAATASWSRRLGNTFLLFRAKMSVRPILRNRRFSCRSIALPPQNATDIVRGARPSYTLAVRTKVMLSHSLPSDGSTLTHHYKETNSGPSS